MKELIKLAEEKGFKSTAFFFGYFSKDGNGGFNPEDHLSKYLWMQELAKWLRDKHDKSIMPPLRYEDGYRNSCISYYGSKVFKTYEEALQEGLTEALKLI